MDSITQFTLGAAVGEAVLGKKIGNKAIILGGIAGTIPDLDVLFYPVLDEVQRLSFHRGFSHSIFFALLLAPLFAWIFTKWFKKNKEPISFKEWTLFWFLGLFTHPLLDCLTTYGTQLFLPFSDYRVAVNSIFVADFFYTLPFLLSVLICLFLKRTNPKRQLINRLGLGISTLYLCLGLFGKMQVNNVFKTALQEQNIEYQKFMTAPTPLNLMLWYSVVATETGNYIGYYSFLDKDKKINFDFYERHEHLLEGIKTEHAVDRLIWFSKGYYTVEKQDDQLFFYDVKFGKTKFENGGDNREIFVFGFEILKNQLGQYRFKQTHLPSETGELNFKEVFQTLWERIKGNEAVEEKALHSGKM